MQMNGAREAEKEQKFIERTSYIGTYTWRFAKEQQAGSLLWPRLIVCLRAQLEFFSFFFSSFAIVVLVSCPWPRLLKVTSCLAVLALSIGSYGQAS